MQKRISHHFLTNLLINRKWLTTTVLSSPKYYTVTVVTQPRLCMFAILIHRYLIPSFSCNVKANITCVTWPLNYWVKIIQDPGIVWILIPCHAKTNVTFVTWPKFLISEMLLHKSFETFQELLNVECFPVMGKLP